MMTTMSRRITSERDMATLVPTNRARTERGEAERPFARARATLNSPGRDDAKPVPKPNPEGQADRARRIDGRGQVDRWQKAPHPRPVYLRRRRHPDPNARAPVEFPHHRAVTR